MLLAASVLAAGAITVATESLAPAPANAANASLFNPGFIISDQNFYAPNALTAAQAQSFIASQETTCTASAGEPCLKSFKVTHKAIAKSTHCAAMAAASNQLASAAIVAVGKACGVSPKVLIVLLEKEQGLVTSRAPTASAYNFATGLDCPDTAPCDASAGGFFNQVFGAAFQFQVYRTNPASFNYQAGRVNKIQFNPNKACGTESVFIQNQATAGLYDYTPYVPDAAALKNLTGVGDSCSSYGNRNFWRLYSDWFGDPAGVPLQCPTFDGCVTGWGFTGTMNRKVFQNADAHSGTGFIDLTTPAPGSSMEQTVARSMTVGDWYQATVWVRTPTAGTTTKGRLVIWGLGGTNNEVAHQSFTATSAWQEVTVNFIQASRSHTSIRFQIYEDSANSHLSVDDASLQQMPAQPLRTAVPIQSPSFETGAAGWIFGNGALNRSVVTGSAASGTHYLATNTTQAGRSIAQDVSWPVSRASSFTATIWVKTQRDKPFSGKLALWSLGGKRAVVATPFTAGSTWQPVTVSLPVPAGAGTDLRIEVYEETVAPQTLLLDDVSLTANLFPNGSLELGTKGWSVHETGTKLVNAAVPTLTLPRPVDGVEAGATTTPVADGSIEANVSRSLIAGQTYTAKIWLRAAAAHTTFTGKLALWELGPAGNSAVTKAVSVTNQWKQFTITTTIKHTGSTTLRLQLYEPAHGPIVYFDGATLN